MYLIKKYIYTQILLCLFKIHLWHLIIGSLIKNNNDASSYCNNQRLYGYERAIYIFIFKNIDWHVLYQIY